MKTQGWGNYPVGETAWLTPTKPGAIGRIIGNTDTLIARGAGRAYGDAAIGAGTTVSTLSMDRMIAFDPQSLELTVEAGVMLDDVIRTFQPRGYFPASVPGTKFVTVGGMVASNIHGKNHHKASTFGSHVTRIRLVGADGKSTACSPTEQSELFRATIGGMGLTGIITEVTFRMQKVETAFMRNELLVARNLDEAMRIFEESLGWSYTVSWIDGLARGNALGRSLIIRSEHAKLSELGGWRARQPLKPAPHAFLNVPFNMPAMTLNTLSVSAFNQLVYWNGVRQAGPRIDHWNSNFFPLDAVHHWNRIYGARGFFQHQCVIPKARSRDAIGEILDRVARAGNPSFLSVLKLMGPDEAGLMTFPMEGYTLTLDFPVSRKSFELADALDAIVLAHGGRLYLTKDSRQSRAMVEAGYENLPRFRDLRAASGAARKFKSLQSERLGL